MIAVRGFLLASACLVASIGAAQAGVLSNGNWESTKCGSRPVAPPMIASSQESVNQSNKMLQAFADKAKDYERCYMAELNADMAAMKSAADTENAQMQAEFDKINANAKAASKQQSKSPLSASAPSSFHSDTPQGRPTTDPYARQNSQ